jgi:hypothetical protein
VLVSIKFDFRECGSMALNGLRHTTLATVKLHSSLYFEGGRIRGIARDANQDHPLFVRRSAIIDNLAARKGRMTVKDFLRGRRRVRYAPVIH